MFEPGDEMDLVKRFKGERQKADCRTTAEWGSCLVGWLHVVVGEDRRMKYM